MNDENELGNFPRRLTHKQNRGLIPIGGIDQTTCPSPIPTNFTYTYTTQQNQHESPSNLYSGINHLVNFYSV